jgi:hypothetical protein
MKKLLRARYAALLIAIAAVGGTTVSSAVNLGISSNNELGAGNSITASCQPSTGPNISVTWGSPTFASGAWTSNTLNLANIAAACAGHSYKIAVADGSGSPLTTLTGTIAGTSLALTLSSAVAATSVNNVSVIIY